MSSPLPATVAVDAGRSEPLRKLRVVEAAASSDAPREIEVFGVPLHPLTMQETVDAVERLIATGGVHQHVVLNAAKVVQMADDPAMADIVRGCSLVNADGQAVVWAGRLLGHQVPERVTGVDLMQEILDRAALRGWSVFFLGARAEVVERVVEIETARHAGLKVAGWHEGFWPAGGEDDVVQQIANSGASVLFVAMPSPRKEIFLSRHLDALGVPFAMGVGGSFDIVAGVTKRAPQWMRRAGLEWSYRLIQEPRRMFRRYLVGNSRFVLLTLRAMSRRSAAV
jgi:N-acetylglucosaminyldiphosphoundecaprenol N-acetyl-beta-D-mannosaminyltransferase